MRNGSFERPTAPPGGFTLFSTKFGNWHVAGVAGNVAVVSGTFTQDGFSFPAGCGMQWLDLTGTSDTRTGVQQAFDTVPGQAYTLTFKVGNVVDPNGISAHRARSTS